MLILSAGIYRSGSTWMFNVARKLRPDAEVVKVHGPHEDRECDMVLTSRRDPVTMMASLVRFGCKDPWHDLSESLRFYRHWSKHPKLAYDMSFEDMVADKPKTVRELATALGSTMDPEEVLSMVEAMKPPPEGIDPLTNLHWNHVTSDDPSSTHPLTPDEIARVRAHHP